MFAWIDRVFDRPVLLFLNEPAGHSWIADMAIVKFMMLDSVKILPIVTAVVLAALMAPSREATNRTFFNALGGAFIAIFIARIVQNLLERSRPLYAEIEGFTVPAGTPLDVPADWSSFPSDTAALAFALAMAVFLRSRPLGMLCMAWALFVTCFPRVYAGYHYPSDIVGGAVIGICSVLVVHAFLPERLFALGEAFMRRHAPVYYAAVFVIMYSTATMFFDIRQTLSAVGDVVSEDVQAEMPQQVSGNVTGSVVLASPLGAEELRR